MPMERIVCDRKHHRWPVRVGIAPLLVASLLVGTTHGLAFAAGCEAPVTAAVPTSLRDLAERAKAAFRRRIEPPPALIVMFDVAEREKGDVQRRYVLRNEEEAIDALLAEGADPERERSVKDALRQLLTVDKSAKADAIFDQISARESACGAQGHLAAAAAWRHSVALAELPAALGARINPGRDVTFKGSGRTMQPLGVLALPAFQRAVELAPGDAWAWLAVAWLSPPAQASVAIKHAAQAANAANDLRASIAVSEASAELMRREGRLAEAVKLRNFAVQELRNRLTPNSAVDARELSLALNSLGAAQLQMGEPEQARLRFEAALKIREDLARARPGDVQAQLDLVASHTMLANVPGSPPGHLSRALEIHSALQQRDRFTPMLGGPGTSGLVISFVVMAGVLTLLLGLTLLTLYGFRVARWMRAAAAMASTAAATGIASRAAQRPLELRALSAATGPATHATAIAVAARAMRHAAWVYGAAGAVFALVATGLSFWLGELDFYLTRFGVLFMSWWWPIVVVLGLLWTGDRRRQWAVYAVYTTLLLLICLRIAFSDTPPMHLFGVTIAPFFQGLVYWFVQAAPSIFLLFFLNRSVRSVGPVLLVAILIASLGGMLSLVALSTVAGRELLFHFPLSVLLRLPAYLTEIGVVLLGMLVLTPLAWWAIGALRSAHRAKRANDQTLVFDAIWLIQAVYLSMSLIQEIGLWGWIGLAAFVPYKLVAVLGLKPLAKEAAQRPPTRLLLLRVFGFRRRTERFFDVLAARWRHVGPIQMIAAPDLASRTIDPDELMDFLAGRLRRHFVIEPGDLQRRVAEFDNGCDADGRFRINEMFCGNDTWRAAVRALMAQSELVLMDLRSFAVQNQGCIFEIAALLDVVPAGRIILLTDASTDLGLLRDTLANCAQRLSVDSPNIAATEAMTLLEVGKDNVTAVRRLLAWADRALDAASRRPSGTPTDRAH